MKVLGYKTGKKQSILKLTHLKKDKKSDILNHIKKYDVIKNNMPTKKQS